MARAKNVLQQVIVLLDNGRIKEQDVHDVLNGSTINKAWIYQNGSLKNIQTGTIVPLSPEKITSISWPKKEKPQTTRFDANIRKDKPSIKPVMPKSDKKD